MNRPLRPPQRVDRLAEGRDPRAAILRVEPGAGIEPLDLVEREVFQHPGAGAGRRRPGAIREHGLDVGRALERVVVQAHDPAVLRQLEIELDEGGPLLRRHHEGGHGVLGRVAEAPRCATSQGRSGGRAGACDADATIPMQAGDHQRDSGDGYAGHDCHCGAPLTPRATGRRAWPSACRSDRPARPGWCSRCRPGRTATPASRPAE